MSPLAALCVTPTEIPSASLNVKIAAGVFRKSDNTIVTYAGSGSEAIASGSTKYLWLTDTGTFTIGTAFPGSATNHVRLAVVTTDSTTVTAIVDARLCFISANTP